MCIEKRIETRVNASALISVISTCVCVCVTNTWVHTCIRLKVTSDLSPAMSKHVYVSSIQSNHKNNRDKYFWQIFRLYSLVDGSIIKIWQIS